MEYSFIEQLQNTPPLLLLILLCAHIAKNKKCAGYQVAGYSAVSVIYKNLRAYEQMHFTITCRNPKK